MEIIQTQTASTSANPAAANVTSVARVTNIIVNVVSIIETPVETVVPTAVNQPLFPYVANRLDASYPWGMPLKFAA